jgi:uncharacterized membrane protein
MPAHGHRHVHPFAEEEEDWQTPIPIGRLLVAGAVAVAVFAVVGLVVWWPSGDTLIDSEAFGFTDRERGIVTEASIEDCSYDPSVLCDRVAVEVTSGPGAGAEATLEFSLDDPGLAGATLRTGDRIYLNDAGPDVPSDIRYSFADFQRGTPLVLLTLLFAAVVVLVGRFRGLFALVGLVVSLSVVIGFVLPALLEGSSPVGVALTGAAVIALAALYLAHGWNQPTTVALLGTIASLTLTAILGASFASAARLTGLASEESINLLAFAPNLDFRGLLLAAMIIGSLGVLDDVTVTQVSAVTELHHANPTGGFRDLYAASVRIGRDHIASATNTLVLAYTAAALPLLLIFTQSRLSLGEVATSEVVAVEIVQTLVGSIGLVASVPITTGLAAWVITRHDRRPHRSR